MPPRVIEDSDDDDDEKSIASVQSSNKIRLMRAPELNTASPASTIPVSMQQHATSSTDPVLFQSDYNETFAARKSPTAGAVSGSQDFPSFTQLISDTVAPRMTSSPEASNKPPPRKDNRMVSTPKFTRKPKRAQSMRDMNDRSPTSVLHTSENAMGGDPWAFPLSSPPDGITTIKQVKSRNALRESAKKNSTKSLRRSKTTMEVIPGTFGRLEEYAKPKPKDGLSPAKAYDQAETIGREGHGGLQQILPSKSSGGKSRMSVNADLMTKATVNFSKVSSDSAENTEDHTSASAMQASIQVARSTSKEGSGESLHVSAGSVIFGTEPIAPIQTEEGWKAQHVGEEPEGSPLDERPLVSVVHPSNLTESQKQQYQLVHCDSPETNAESSLPNSTIDTAPTGIPAISSVGRQDHPGQGAAQVFAHEPRFSSSPPMITGARRLKRTQSEVQRSPLSSAASNYPPNGQKLKRSETINAPNKSSPSQGSVDEISLESNENSTIEILSNKIRKGKRPRQTDDRVTIVEMFGSDDIGLPTERYKPRLSRRRSHGTGTTAPDEEKAGSVEPRSKRIKSTKEVLESSISVVDGPVPPFSDMVSGSVTTNGSGRSTLIPTDELFQCTVDPLVGNKANKIAEQIPSSNILVDIPSEPATRELDNDRQLEIKPQPTVRKKRGRPPGRRKTAPVLGSPRIADETLDMYAVSVPVPETIYVEKPASMREKIEVGKAGDIDSRKLLASPGIPADATSIFTSQDLEPARTPPQPEKSEILQATHNTPSKTAEVKRTEPAKPATPIKPVKAADHHSPLQSGKVPYRVGLSRRNRIAPLLKVIRK